GTSSTAPMTPTASGEPVSSLICSGRATRAMKLPKYVISPCTHSRRKSREERQGERSGSTAESFEVTTGHPACAPAHGATRYRCPAPGVEARSDVLSGLHDRSPCRGSAVRRGAVRPRQRDPLLRHEPRGRAGTLGRAGGGDDGRGGVRAGGGSAPAARPDRHGGVGGVHRARAGGPGPG